MAQTVWSAFYDYIMPELPGIGTNVVNNTLRQVAIEFCNETSIHVHDLPAINLVATQSTYTLTSDITDTEVWLVKNAWMNGTPMDKASLDTLASFATDWRTITTNSPSIFTQYQPDQITLYPQPDTNETGWLKVQVCLRPTLTSAGVQDWIANQYTQELPWGTKARLMMMPAVPWSNPQLGQHYEAMFQSAKTRAGIDSNRSLVRAGLTVQMRPAAR